MEPPRLSKRMCRIWMGGEFACGMGGSSRLGVVRVSPGESLDVGDSINRGDQVRPGNWMWNLG